MQVKIYFNNKPLFLTDAITKDLQDYMHQQDTIFIDVLDSHTVKTMIFEMGQPEIRRGIFLHHNVEALLNEFKLRLILIQAAGGFVYTPQNELLLIFRRGKWDLPKGKLDPGETLEECAMREIKEETGLGDLKLRGPLTVTYHTYWQEDQHIIKESHWFLLQAASAHACEPQLEEDIETCEWVPFARINPYLDHTHASLVDVVRNGIGEVQASNPTPGAAGH